MSRQHAESMLRIQNALVSIRRYSILFGEYCKVSDFVKGKQNRSYIIDSASAGFFAEDAPVNLLQTCTTTPKQFPSGESAMTRLSLGIASCAEDEASARGLSESVRAEKRSGAGARYSQKEEARYGAQCWSYTD